MNIQILHLSDIHIRAKRTPSDILSFGETIATTLNGNPACSLILIILTGDIAFSGQSSEYVNAAEFLQSIKDYIQTHHPSSELHIAVVPGNHDCDFGKPNTVRDSVIWGLKGHKISADDNALDALTSAQANYFDFAKKFMPVPFTNSSDKVSISLRIPIKDKVIQVNCINSAWMSELKESQGTLLAPTPTISEYKSDLVISVFHHPTNWFESESARTFKSLIETSSDLILTGHEHHLAHMSQEGLDGESNEIISGGELQGDGHSTASAFNLVFLNLDKQEFEVTQFHGKKGTYEVLRKSGVKSIRRSAKLQQRHFPFSDAFGDFLTDPGIVITHPRIERLKLDQFFVHPDLREIQSGGDPVTGGKHVVGLASSIRSAKTALIVGNEKSGKTSLAKFLVTDFHKDGFVPIYITGDNITSVEIEKTKRLIRSNVEEQYSAALIDNYEKTPTSLRIIIVDNFQYCPLNAVGKTEWLSKISTFADYLVILTDDIIPLSDLLTGASTPGPLFKSATFQIKEMGFVRREQLIKKWIRLGQEYSITDQDLIFETNRIANGISGVLQQKVIPAYPIMVLSVLQMLELQTPMKATHGTYGYFYEMMLTQTLTNKWRSQDVDKLYTYLAALAYDIFSASGKPPNEERMRAFTKEFCTTYATQIDIETTLRKLIECRILLRRGDSYEFKYNYLYFYFIARYFRDNIEDAQTRGAVLKHITNMASALHVEENANILIFFSYLAKTPIIIDEILRNAKDFYKDHEWCDLEKDAAFASSGSVGSVRFSLQPGTPIETREMALQRRDELAEEDAAEIATRQEKQTADLLRMNAAFKTLEILGQIARNFSGSLKADQKYRITEECYALGLRTLKLWLSTIESNVPTFQRYVGDYLLNEERILDEEDRRKKTSFILFFLTEILSFSLLKKISASVGSEELEEIYSRILNSHPTKSVELLNIAIKLEHFNHLPAQEIIDFHELNQKNYFLKTMITLMVTDHFHMFPVDRHLRDRLCDKLEIAKNDPLLIINDQKKFKKMSS